MNHSKPILYVPLAMDIKLEIYICSLSNDEAKTRYKEIIVKVTWKLLLLFLLFGKVLLEIDIKL